MTKKRSSEILVDENEEMLREEVNFCKFSTESEIFSKIGGNLKQKGKCIMVSGGMDAPAQAQDSLTGYAELCILSCCSFYLEFTSLTDLIDCPVPGSTSTEA